MRGYWLLLGAGALAGCTHTSVMPLAGDTLEITSSAAPICGAAGAQSVAVRRAAIETISHGYDRFIVVNAAAQNNVGVIGYTPLQATTNGTANVYGNGNFATGYGQSNTYVTGGQPIIGGHHDQALVIKMFKDGDPAGANAVSARQTLGPDWQQKVSEGLSTTCG